MHSPASLNERGCPVCHTPHVKAKLFFKNNIDSEKLSSFSFASRKTPEFMTHRLVQCPVCDLVYANQPPSEDELARAYHVADYDSAEEAGDAAAAYMQAMKSTLLHLVPKHAALEIGTGTGVLLEQLSLAGFDDVMGVEPSVAAIAAAPEHRKAWIREGIFVESDFKPGSLDLICCFMTMEHVRDPKVIADAALRILRPGGVFITITHNYRSLVNRMLGRRSPIIDIEHMQIFSDKSIRYLFEASGFGAVSVNAFANRYALGYWMRLSPLPAFLKSAVMRCFNWLGWSRWRLRINVGNTITVGYKPAEAP
jgi:SAM-dependent methyltransferase